jgi:hypothetical protein
MITKTEMDEMDALLDRYNSLTPEEEQRLDHLYEELAKDLPGIDIIVDFLTWELERGARVPHTAENKVVRPEWVPYLGKRREV